LYDLYLKPYQKSHKFFFSLKFNALLRYEELLDIIANDNISSKKSLTLYYILLSCGFNSRIKIKRKLAPFTPILSLSHLFSSAHWLEREIWDLFGIFFNHNEDLRRILTDYGFTGHALRKTFPCMGYTQVRYEESLKRIVIEPVVLTQDFRQFTSTMPWQL